MQQAQQQIRADVRMVIIAGENHMTKTGKIANLYKLLGKNSKFRHDAGVAFFDQVGETFTVVKGQRGAMGVNMYRRSGEVGLNISEDGQEIYTSMPHVGKEVMRWERHVTVDKDLLTESGGTTAQEEQTEQGQAGFRELGQHPGTLNDRMVEGMWVDPKAGLQAKVVFEERVMDGPLAKYLTDTGFGNLYFGAVAKNIHRLRGNDALEVTFAVLVDSQDPRIALREEDGAITSWRIDPENLDMFQGDEIKLDDKVGSFFYVTLSEVATYHVPAEGYVPQIMEFPEATVNFTPAGKLDAHELSQLFDEDDLQGIVRAIVLHEQTALSRKWTASWVVRYILNEGSEYGHFIIERVRVNDEAEQVGDVYEIKDNVLKLLHHRNLFKQFEGPTFIITPVEYKTAVPERSSSLANLSREVDLSARGRESRGEETRGRGSFPRGLVRETVCGEDTTSRHPRHEEEEQARVHHAKVPTREWIPQQRQYVTVEGDETGEVYIIEDFDMYTRKFVLMMADSLRASRQQQLGKPVSITVEAGRLRPFTLFY